jgi:hypothetical protein
VSDKKVFKEGVIPDTDQMPPERTHARAKLIYRVFKAVAFMKKDKRHIALQEIKDRNKILWERVMHYLGQTTDEEIRFLKGPRPWYHEDGKLAIYHPIKDNPLLMKVYEGEQPEDGGKTGAEKKLWLPR